MNTKWNLELVKKEASKHRKRSDFKKACEGGYFWAKKNNYLNQICSHMKSRRSLTFEYCRQECLKYSTRRELILKDNPVYLKCLKMGWLDSFCRQMARVQRKPYTKNECERVIKNCKNRWELQKNYGGVYNKCRKKWPELLQLLPARPASPDKKKCEKIALKYASIREFRENDHNIYRKVICNWPEMIEHLPRQESVGWSKTSFVSLCDEQNKGFADFYLLLCYDDFEKFYKFGITTNFEKRYAKPRDLPYDFEVLNLFTAKSSFVWDFERYCLKESKFLRYFPQVCFAGSAKECFVCHQNNKFFRRLKQ